MKITLNTIDVEDEIICELCDKHIAYTSESIAEGIKFWCMNCAKKVEK